SRGRHHWRVLPGGRRLDRDQEPAQPRLGGGPAGAHTRMGLPVRPAIGVRAWRGELRRVRSPVRQGSRCRRTRAGDRPVRVEIRIMNAAGGLRVLMLLENNAFPQDRRVAAEASALTQAGYRVTVIAPALP